MALMRIELDIGKYIKADEMWYGIDRTEGEVGLKIPIRYELVGSQKAIEAQLILNMADDLMRWCQRTHRGQRAIKDAENIEIDMICAENPANAGVRLIDAGATTRDPYFIRIYLNKTFGINNLNITWGMCSDETLLVHYMNDLKQRYCSDAGVTAGTPAEVTVNLNFGE